MLWYKEVGFNTNPFSIKPAPFDYKIIGYDLKEIFENIAKGEILFIEGKYGFGKTTMLKSIIHEFGGRRDVAYYSCNRQEKEINVEGLLKGKFGTLGRLFSLMPEDMILLLDEVEQLTKQDQEDLLRHRKEGHIKSIVFFGANFEKASFDVELKKLMVNNVIQLTKLTPEEAVELVRERIGHIKLLPDNIIKKAFKLSDQNPRLMLENLEDLCRYAVENNDEEVTEESIGEVLKIKEKKPRKKKKKPKKAKKKEPQNTDENIFVEEIDKPEEVPPEPPVFEPQIYDKPDKEEPEYFY